MTQATCTTCKGCPHLEYWQDEDNSKRNQWDCGHDDASNPEMDGLGFIADNQKKPPAQPYWCPLTLHDRAQTAFTTFQALITENGHQSALDSKGWECPFCRTQYLTETETRPCCKCLYCKGLGSTAKQFERMLDALLDSARELGKTDLDGAIARLDFIIQNFRGSYWSSEARMTLRAFQEAAKTPDLKERVRQDVLPVLESLRAGKGGNTDALQLMRSLEKLPANESESRRVFTVMYQILNTDSRWVQYTPDDYGVMAQITNDYLNAENFFPMEALKQLDRLYHSHVSIQGASFKSC